jgi:hypothetical protein
MRLAAMVLAASFIATSAVAQDADRSVADGGIKVSGWEGRVDRRPLSQGKTIDDSKFVAEDGGFRMSVGPAAFYWNPANTASGDYEVKATITELHMTAGHPHSFGVFIGGADLKSDTETLMYCIVYGNGTYSVKTFHGANVVTLVDRETNAALHKADENGRSTNEIGWRVQGGNASCVVNGTVVKTLPRSEVVAADKLKSTDGIYGIRVSHNLELMVTGFGKSST